MNQQIEKLVVKRRHLNGLKKKKRNSSASLEENAKQNNRILFLFYQRSQHKKV